MLLAAIVSAFFVGGLLRPRRPPRRTRPSKPAAGKETKKIVKDVVYDGDKKGENAKGWGVPEGKSTVAAQDKEVRTKGKKTVEFHAKGTEWMGCGWNWFGWSPEDAGTDISKQKNLCFWAKVTGERSPTELPLARAPTTTRRPRRATC